MTLTIGAIIAAVLAVLGALGFAKVKSNNADKDVAVSKQDTANANAQTAEARMDAEATAAAAERERTALAQANADAAQKASDEAADRQKLDAESAAQSPEEIKQRIDKWTTE
jgi:hypothetical protein